MRVALVFVLAFTFAGKRELRVKPRELAIAESRSQSNLAAGLLRNLHAKVHGVSSAGWNETHIYHGARCPGVALVNRIAVRIHLQRTIEVCAFFNRSLAVVLDHATPENRLAFVVDAFKFEPGVISVNRPSGEEMADAFGAHHDINANGVSATHGSLHTIKRSGNGSSLDIGT